MVTEKLLVFRERLKDFIDDGEDVKSFAAGAGIELSRLYDYLSGKHAPSAENAIKIARYCKCTLNYLFGFEKDYKKAEICVAESPCARFKAAIDGSGISRYRLGKELNVSQSRLSRWYNGVQTPELVSLLAVAEHLEIPLDFLAGLK